MTRLIVDLKVDDGYLYPIYKYPPFKAKIICNQLSKKDSSAPLK